MNYFTLAVLLCALLPVANADCYLTKIDKGATHCQDLTDKTWHAVGSQWRNSDCMDCTCGQCCSTYVRPTHYPSDCVSVFDSKECQYIVHMKDNPEVRCPVFGAVGK